MSRPLPPLPEPIHGCALPPYVADGEPCPRHGAPARLLWMPGLGLYSQCRGCIEDFLDWFGAQEAARAKIDIHQRPSMQQTLDLS